MIRVMPKKIIIIVLFFIILLSPAIATYPAPFDNWTTYEENDPGGIFTHNTGIYPDAIHLVTPGGGGQAIHVGEYAKLTQSVTIASPGMHINIDAVGYTNLAGGDYYHTYIYINNTIACAPGTSTTFTCDAYFPAGTYNFSIEERITANITSVGKDYEIYIWNYRIRPTITGYTNNKTQDSQTEIGLPAGTYVNMSITSADQTLQTYNWSKDGTSIPTNNNLNYLVTNYSQKFNTSVPELVPNSVSGLTLWLKADSLSLNNGDLVGTWTDSSGNGHDATQVNTTRKPTYKTNILNGKPGLVFDGIQTFMDVSSLSSQTFFIVLNHSDKNVFGDQRTIIRNRISPYENIVGMPGGTSYGTFAISNVRVNQVLTTSAAPINDYRVMSFNTNTLTTKNIEIGDFYEDDPPPYPFYGYILEIIAYNGTLSDSNRSGVELYLANKYGLNTNRVKVNGSNSNGITTNEITWTLKLGASIPSGSFIATGTVNFIDVDGTTATLPNAFVKLNDTLYTYTDGTGKYSILAPNGTYTVSVNKSDAFNTASGTISNVSPSRDFTLLYSKGNLTNPILQSGRISTTYSHNFRTMTLWGNPNFIWTATKFDIYNGTSNDKWYYRAATNDGGDSFSTNVESGKGNYRLYFVSSDIYNYPTTGWHPTLSINRYFNSSEIYFQESEIGTNGSRTTIASNLSKVQKEKKLQDDFWLIVPLFLFVLIIMAMVSKLKEVRR